MTCAIVNKLNIDACHRSYYETFNYIVITRENKIQLVKKLILFVTKKYLKYSQCSKIMVIVIL